MRNSCGIGIDRLIRNFIYLDSQKLRSISSQLFEGVTEQIVQESGAKEASETQQKGPVNSGRLVADIFAKNNSSSELRFLEDHAYTLLEDKLIESGAVNEYGSGSEAAAPTKNFVKVTGTLAINDTAVSAATLKNFNAIGEAQWRSTNETGQTLKPLGDTEARKQARDMGLQLNHKWTDALSRLLEFGYGGLLEFHVQTAGPLFSAPIKREFLRESERMILHKYSRLTQMPFTILGVVTQRYEAGADATEIPDVSDSSGLKVAMRTLSLHMRNLEQTYSGPVEGEVILDPIAVYTVI
jgi:hypothetical protein